MCGSTNPGTTVRPPKLMMRTPGPAAGATFTAKNRPFRMVTEVAMVLAASMVWIRPLVSTRVSSAGMFWAETTPEAGPAARAAAPAVAPRNRLREDRLSFIGRIIALGTLRMWFGAHFHPQPHEAVRKRSSSQQSEPGSGSRRDPRISRAERRRQDHHDSHPARSAAAQQRQRLPPGA